MSAGVMSRMGWVGATTWGEAHVAASILIPFRSEAITKAFDQQRSAALVGQVAENESFNGHQYVQGGVEFDLDYAAWLFLMYAFGGQNAGTLELANDLSVMAHLHIDKGIERYLVRTAMGGKLAISGEAGSEDPVKCAMDVIASAAETSATAFPSLSQTPNRVYMSDLVYFRVGDTVDALAAGDALHIKSFEITIDNALKGDDTDTSSRTMRVKPIRNGFRKVTCKVGIARYGATGASNLEGWKSNGTWLQGMMSFVRGGNSVTIYMPQMKITEGANWNVGGPGAIADEVTFELFRNRVNTTNMSAVADQIEIAFV